MIVGGEHIWAADGGAPGHTPLGVSPGTVRDYGPGPTWTTMRVGPNLIGDEEQTTLASDGDGFSIWAGNKDSKTVRQIDMSLHTTLLTIHGIAPGGLAAVGNSSTGDTVWASDPAHNLAPDRPGVQADHRADQDPGRACASRCRRTDGLGHNAQDKCALAHRCEDEPSRNRDPAFGHPVASRSGQWGRLDHRLPILESQRLHAGRDGHPDRSEDEPHRRAHPAWRPRA